MKRVLVLSFLVTVLVLGAALPVSAGWTWCATDPHIQLPDGGVIHIWVAVPEDDADETIYLVVDAPEGSKVLGNGNSGQLNVVTDLNAEGDAHEVRVTASAADADLMFWAKHRGSEIFPDEATGVLTLAY